MELSGNDLLMVMLAVWLPHGPPVTLTARLICPAVLLLEFAIITLLPVVEVPKAKSNPLPVIISVLLHWYVAPGCGTIEYVVLPSLQAMVSGPLMLMSVYKLTLIDVLLENPKLPLVAVHK